MGIKPAMGQPGIGHQPGNADGLHTLLAEAPRRRVDDAAAGLFLVAFIKPHSCYLRLHRIMIDILYDD